MSKSKLPNDLMGNLLSGKPAKKHDSKPESRNAGKPAIQQASNTGLQKATYRLPADLLLELEEKILQRRREGNPITRSGAVAEALRKWIKDE